MRGVGVQIESGLPSHQWVGLYVCCGQLCVDVTYQRGIVRLASSRPSLSVSVRVIALTGHMTGGGGGWFLWSTGQKVVGFGCVGWCGACLEAAKA